MVGNLLDDDTHYYEFDGETGEPPTYKKCWVACGVSGLRTLVMSSMV